MRMTKNLAAATIAMTTVAAVTPLAEAATRTQKSFSGWQVDCTEPDDGKKTCALQYSLLNQKNRQLVFSWTIVKGDKDGGPHKAVIRTPNGVLLSEGVNIGFEGANPVKVNYFTCGPRACLAEFDFTDQWSKALSGNEKVIVNLKAANEKPVKFDISLTQFSDAYSYFKTQLSEE
jgi:invasion protein IalB